MRNFIIASAVALASTISFGVSANAAPVMVAAHHMHRSHCVVKTVKHRDRHGHWVVSKNRVCH